ncbi:hypothetical protein LPB248_12180 [Flavobacterium sp. LPB0248]|uniref:hypothetical protein n=1 Tax=Flavobacterium sp. LPB0248 TaxID=2614441 RepID=UPI0015A69406|nr:hypothetical protein [Flavobacterium sp. LPB0248]QLC67026.1 hypothetical protein LPB248_12180 [Flavobacterium sp. LPB0248]
MKKKILLVILFSFEINFGQNIFPTNGNVGIGTISPASGLEIRGSSQVGYEVGTLKLRSETLNQFMYFGYDDQYSAGYIQSVKPGTAQQNILLAPWGGNIGVGTVNPETLLNVSVGSGGVNGTAGIRVGGLYNYSSLEFGIDGDYDGMIRSYGNNINYYAGHWKSKGISASEDHSHNWYTSKKGSSDWSSIKMTLNENGNLGVGIINPSNKLDVNGTIHSQEVKVDMNNWSDFVFKKGYNLPTLEQVERHIVEKGHLENIPNEEEVLKNGISLGEMNAKLLQKIEEMTLYIIEQNKQIIDLNKRLEKVELK